MTAPECPECRAALFADLEDWWRCSHAATCRIGGHEDGQALADVERVPSGRGGFTRATTPAERVLLAARGLTAPIDSRTVVSFMGSGMRFRKYPDAKPTATGGTP